MNISDFIPMETFQTKLETPNSLLSQSFVVIVDSFSWTERESFVLILPFIFSLIPFFFHHSFSSIIVMAERD